MPLSLFEGALGGIGLFLLGMRIMSGGIRKVADDRIRNVLATFTSNRFYSFICGMALSMLFNSASAAVIITIGLANGGVLSAFQVLSVLSGVLVGASLTLHIPGIPYSLVATPFVFIGVLLKFFSRSRRLSNVGDLLLGMGLLFLGLTLLEGSFRPHDHHPFYDAFNGIFFRNSVLSMFFGGIISCFVQSTLSSANVVATLVSSHHLSMPTATNMMLGGIVGVAAIGGLASIGGTSVSRRLAAVFMTITIIVILLLITVTPYLLEMVQLLKLHFVMKGEGLNGRQFSSQLAWVHTISSLITAFCIIMLSGLVSRISGARDDHGIKGAVPQPCAGYLDVRILNTPTLAIEQSRKEIVRMMSVTSFMFADIREILSDFDARRAATIRQHEEVLDSLNHEITTFLAALARSNANPEISYEIPGLLQTVTDLEHIGDSCEEILDGIITRKESNIIFSDAAMNDLKQLARVVETIIIDVEDVIKNDLIPDMEGLREIKHGARVIFDQIKQSHFDRICTGVCPPRAAMLFNELTDAFVRIAELCWNVIAVQGRKTK